MTPALSLVESLSPAQQAAIKIIKLSLDCFNSADGSGLFTGTLRYAALAGRVEICAAQARDLHQFWALLLRRMQWSVPPKDKDAAIVEGISAPSPRDVLRVLATETTSIITLSRMLHDQDKSARRAAKQAEDTSPFTDDSLENI